MQLEVFKTQNAELLKELSSLSEQVTDLQDENTQLESQLNRMLGRPDAIKDLTLEECEAIERNLKATLEAIEKKKVSLIRMKISSQKEQRLCVICQERYYNYFIL